MNEDGQSTVEAAFALPVLMILFLLLLQPGIVLYDRMVMSGAAADGCRLLATSAGAGDVEDDYVRRRLSAIPQIDQFHLHSGGCSYEIEMSGSEKSSEVTVSISNKLKPLPLLDAGMALLGLTDSSGLLTVSVESTMQTQPDWVDASGTARNPYQWVMT